MTTSLRHASVAALVLATVLLGLPAASLGEDLILNCRANNGDLFPVRVWFNPPHVRTGERVSNAQISAYEIAWEFPDPYHPGHMAHEFINRTTAEFHFMDGSGQEWASGTCTVAHMQF